jgi:hypothetical protein
MIYSLRSKTREKYYVRGRYSNVDCFYLAQNYFKLPRQTIRENAIFICLFNQNGKTINHINGKNPWFAPGCKSQCSHTLKTANIKSCYDPRSTLWYYKAYNRAF